MASSPDPYDFSDLLILGRSELRSELAQCVAELATAIEHEAFLKCTDKNGWEHVETAGRRDALNEKKWLIMRLMDTSDG